jgi:hypothetical protein
MTDATHTVRFAEPHELTDGDETVLEVAGYEDFGSMYALTLLDGTERSVGKQLIEEVTSVE